jgi:hypothetical protein
MKSSHDKLHRDLAFQVDDWVWLRLHRRSAASITDSSASKLSPHFYGPFQVIERVGSVAYRLRLPPKACIHDVFHVVFLKKYEGTPPTGPGQLPPIGHGRVLPVPAKVMRAMPTGGSWQLLIQWEGGSADDATFEGTISNIQTRGRAFWSGGGLWAPSLARHMGAEPRPKRPQQISRPPRLIQGPTE